MSFAALALRARAANDTTRAQINNIPEKSHVIPLFTEVEVASGGYLVYTKKGYPELANQCASSTLSTV